MEHGVTWLMFLPGYKQLEAYFLHAAEQRGHTHGVLGNPLSIQHVVAAALVLLILLLVSFKARGELKRAADGGLVPSPKVSISSLLDFVFEGLYRQMHDIIGPDAKRYFPVIASLAMFIFFSNVLGLVPGFTPPTDNWNTTFACGIFVFLYYNFHGLRVNGWGHLAHMANPTGQWWGWFMAPLMLPIEIVSHIARPASLGVRLATNMIGDHAVLGAFLALVPVLVPLPFMFLGLFVSVIQTFVFVLLSMIYISLSVAVAHHNDEHGHDGEGAHAAAH